MHRNYFRGKSNNYSHWKYLEFAKYLEVKIGIIYFKYMKLVIIHVKKGFTQFAKFQVLKQKNPLLFLPQLAPQCRNFYKGQRPPFPFDRQSKVLGHCKKKKNSWDHEKKNFHILSLHRKSLGIDTHSIHKCRRIPLIFLSFWATNSPQKRQTAHINIQKQQQKFLTVRDYPLNPLQVLLIETNQIFLYFWFL